jgi:hypothetical protein
MQYFKHSKNSEEIACKTSYKAFSKNVDRSKTVRIHMDGAAVRVKEPKGNGRQARIQLQEQATDHNRHTK